MILNSEIIIAAQRSVDGKMFKVVNNKHVPYDSMEEVKETWELVNRHIGQEFRIYHEGLIRTCHFIDDIQDSNLELVPIVYGDILEQYVQLTQDYPEIGTLINDTQKDFNKKVSDKIVGIIANKVDKELGKSLISDAELLRLSLITSGDKYYRHTQGVPSTTWNIAHNLGKIPSVTVVDSSGTEMEGELTYTNDNNCIISFSAPFSGYADFN